MSMVLTRSPLEPIGMNAGGAPKRRSARLSHEGDDANEPPVKKTKASGTASTTTTVSTKDQDGNNDNAAAKRKRKVYEEEVENFAFSRGKRSRAKQTKEPTVRNSLSEKQSTETTASAPPIDVPAPAPAPTQPPPAVDEALPKTAQKKARRRLPTTPDRDDVQKIVRRSKRLSDEKAPEVSPQRPVHAKSHINTAPERSPSPERARPLTIEKTRKRGPNGVEEEKVMLITLPFADTPIIQRNKAMRKTSGEGHRRSSAGMRGRRASSLIDEGRGHEASMSDGTELATLFAEVYSVSQDLADGNAYIVALPHAEVPASEFFKHISADLTEPRRMRCLLGWCGTRSLPPKPDAPKESTPAANLEFQARQAAQVIQEEISQDLITKGTLSDWFSRDESAPPLVPLRKKPNPRNVANTAKADELERELDRLKNELAEWDGLVHSAASTTPRSELQRSNEGQASPLRPDVLDTPQRNIFEKLTAPDIESAANPEAIEQRLKEISEDLEFTIDQFAHGVHALSTTRETADRVAERSLADAATVLEKRDKQRAAAGNPVDQMDALRGLARVLNAQYR